MSSFCSNQKPAGLTKSGTNDGYYGDTEQQMRGSTRTFSHVTACGNHNTKLGGGIKKQFLKKPKNPLVKKLKKLLVKNQKTY